MKYNTDLDFIAFMLLIALMFIVGAYVEFNHSKDQCLLASQCIELQDESASCQIAVQKCAGQ